MDSSVLKKIQIEIRDIELAVENLRTTVSEKQRELAKKMSKLTELKNKLDNMKAKGITVSEHAQIRFFERVLGINFAEYVHFIVTPAMLQQVAIIGDGNYPFSYSDKKFYAQIKNNVVVTLKEVK